MDLAKKAKSIKITSIVAILMVILIIIGVVVAVTSVGGTEWVYDPYFGDYYQEASLNIAQLIIGVVLIVIAALVSGIMTLVNAIRILATDWKDESLKNDKTLWGILTLLILGPIASLIFGIKATKTLGSSSSQQ